MSQSEDSNYSNSIMWRPPTFNARKERALTRLITRLYHSIRPDSMQFDRQMPTRQQQQTAERGWSNNKAKGKERGTFLRSVSFKHQQTAVFHGGPREVLPTAVLLGDVDNDPRGEAEVAIGGVDGTLAIFKSDHTSPGPFLVSSGLGKLSVLGLGPLLLRHSDTQQLIACAGEGVCHIFNIRPHDVRWDSDSCCGRVEPLWSIPCPLNVTACCIADVNADRRHEVILGTREGVVHVLSIEVNPEEQEVEGRDGASAKDPRRAKQGTAASTPCPREDISSGMYSTSTPPIEELALEHGEKWVADVENASDHGQARETARDSSEPSSEVSELHWEDGKQTPPPDIGISAVEVDEEVRRREWPEQSPTDTEKPGVTVQLNPRFKSLLQLPARGPVTSLAIVHLPETDGTAPTSEKSGPGPTDSGINHGACGGLTAQDELGGRYGFGHRCSGETRNSGGLGSSQRPECAESATGYSAEGVYVAIGIEVGGVEVVRLSRRRPGSRFLELVDPSGRSDEASEGDDHRDGPPRAREEVPDEVPVGEAKPHSNEIQARGSVVSRGPAAIGAEMRGGDHAREDPPLRRPDAQQGDRSRESDPPLFSWTAGRGRSELVPSAQRSWRVPVEKTAAVPRALGSEHGWGLVVGLAASVGTAVTASAPDPAAVTPTGTVPPSRVFPEASRWGSGRHATERASGVGSGRCGGEVGKDDDEQAFAVCLSGRCVGSCRVVSTVEGLPRWRVVWTKQTEESFMAFQRLDYANGQGTSRGKRENLLVACCYSGNTIVFTADGSHCVEFDPGQFLKHPLTAFAAGDWTTSSGSTEPSLVYVSAGGDVVVYHGLIEKAESMPSAQFLPTLHENGSIAVLRDLLENLAERLRWRSNQGDLLFSAPRSSDSTDGVSVAPDSPTAAPAPSALSDDEREESTLSLPDAILARAVLCPVGIAVTSRGKDRRRSGGDGVGGSSTGGGVVDDERWHREARALARGKGSTVTVGEGAAAAERVLREMRAWEDRGKEPTLRHFPCLRETLAALTLWGSGSRRELLQNALKGTEDRTETCASPS